MVQLHGHIWLDFLKQDDLCQFVYFNTEKNIQHSDLIYLTVAQIHKSL